MDRRRFSSILAAVPAFGQSATDPKVEEVLAKVARNYEYMKSYHFVGKTVETTSTPGKKPTAPIETGFEFAIEAPNKFRVAFRYPDGGEWVRVSDGESLYQSRTATKQKEKNPLGEYDMRIPFNTFVGGYRQLATRITSPAIAGSESVTVGGQSIDCWVVEGVEPRTVPESVKVMPTRWWVDKQRHIVVRQLVSTRTAVKQGFQEVSRDTVFEKASMDEPVPASAFALK